MRLVDIRKVTLPIASPIANAYIDFYKMTHSLMTDVVGQGGTIGRVAAPLHGQGEAKCMNSLRRLGRL